MNSILRQRGVALVMLLVLLVMAGLALLLAGLGEMFDVHLRRAQTDAVLAQARDALLGRALSNANMPGSLPCPDLVTNLAGNNVPNDGVADLLSGTQCPAYLGHLPWRTLGLGDLRDADGERLWYVLSPNFRDDDSAQPLNSDSHAQLSWADAEPNQLVALIFAPGAALDGQMRTPSNANDVRHFLEGGNVDGDLVFSRQFPAAVFNDRSIAISAEMLMSGVERRVLREARACLDEYVSLSGGKYPWAAPVSDTSRYLGRWQTYFGRFPAQPNTLLIAVSAETSNFIEAVTSVQIALNHYTAANNGNTRDALAAAASQLKSTTRLVSAPIAAGMQDEANLTADVATSLSKKTSSAGASVIQLQQTELQQHLNSLRQGLSAAGLIDAGMPLAWGSRCTLFSAGYWASWRNLLFYQLAIGVEPGGGGGCGSQCLRVSSSHPVQDGRYPAVVVHAGAALSQQNRANPADLSAYLEAENVHNTPSTYFVSHGRREGLQYRGNNDLVLCVDGGKSCR